MKRMNSHICSIAYPILESAGVLSSSRLKESPSPTEFEDVAPMNGVGYQRPPET
jgi:hypothetical protein